MSSVSFMERLLDRVEVEWKVLSDVFHLKNGYTPSKSKKEFWENGTVPWFRMDDIRQNGKILNNSLLKISESAVKGGRLFPANSIIVATSATIGEHALITVPYLANQRFTCLILKDKYTKHFDIKFLYYYCFLLADWCTKNTTMSSFASVEMDGFKKFLIPIPCPENPKKSLEIQAEIVRILDAFTAHSAELTAELTVRKKQYNHYRDKLLSFEEGEVEWNALENVICSLKTGLNPRQNFQLNTQDAQCFYVTVREIQNGRVTFLEKTDRVNEKALKLINGRSNLEAGDILFSGTGTVGRTAVIEEKPDNWNIKEGVYVIKPNQEKILPRYLSHLLNASDTVRQYTKKIVGNPVVSLPMSDLKRLSIPTPSLAEQERLTTILDKFDTLTNSITEGLPREIALRQKQYEYYRDLLLSFPQQGAT